MAIRFGALVAVLMAGCGDTGNPSTPPPPPIALPPNPPPAPPPARLCSGDEFAYLSWTLDGEPGEACSPTPRAGFALDNCGPAACPPISAEVLSFWFGGTSCLMPAPYVGATLNLFNTDLPFGASGSLVAEQGRRERPVPLAASNDSLPYGDVELGFRPTGDDECEIAANVVFSTGGVWLVAHEGALGDIVELEAREVTFPPTDGHDLRITRIYWRVRLPSPDPQPEPPRPRDGGV